MKTRLNLILIVIVGLFLAAILSRNGGVALLALPFLGYLAIAITTLPQRTDLVASREISCRRTRTGAPVEMKIRLENRGDRVFRLMLRNELTAKMQVLGQAPTQPICLPAGDVQEFSYSFCGVRGRYAWQHVKVEVGDCFGLFGRVVEIPAVAGLLVLPDDLHLKRFRFHPRPTLRTAGPNLSRQPGRGTDFWGVRQYYAGDPMRLIHWRMAARHPQRFFSKEFEREEMADIGILLDGRAAVNLELADASLFEYGVQTAAALGRAFLRSGNRVSLLVLGDRVTQVFPGYGKRHLARILDRLAACEPGDMVAFDTMQYFPVRQFPPGSVIVLISPLRNRDIKTISRLRGDGYQLLVISPNPLEYAQGMSRSAWLAYRAARIEREIMLRRIRKLGVKVIDWRIHQPLETALNAHPGRDR